MKHTLAMVFFLFAVGCIAGHLCGCHAACAVIDLAHATCPAVVRYVDQAGVEHTVTLTNDDAAGLAAVKAARRDGGAP